MIYLASKSPRRAELLLMMGIAFETLKVDIPEVRQAFERPNQYSMRITTDKLNAAWSMLKDTQMTLKPVLCADTEVVIDDEVLGKPESREEAFAMIARYSNHHHLVLTSVGIRTHNFEKVLMNETRVYFDNIPDKAIHTYLDSGDYKDKSGSYGIQSYIGQFIKKIEGSFYGVMGLPLNEVRQLIEIVSAIPEGNG